jgi:hypothetical protein
MTDITTKKPLQVSTEGTAGPYLMVPVPQLDSVRSLLDDHRVRYWLDESAISFNGQPYIAVVNLGRKGDASRVQAILDAAP